MCSEEHVRFVPVDMFVEGVLGCKKNEIRSSSLFRSPLTFDESCFLCSFGMSTVYLQMSKGIAFNKNQ